ncbi:hypothetical protein RFI_25653 [Reticulomyxa filosa]|uniref:Viral A-type inclusion protein n=1 Tax=Reticulomyxa filosa TaxID=46433 RepID=X6MDH8_RETFI|nr:hypothetical protein RFI_25653 [Reticulomyxa filosa]|eukprot:ETO11726.1 hypothetical protein RFI_25653 [Reticulomyxa filosa]
MKNMLEEEIMQSEKDIYYMKWKLLQEHKNVNDINQFLDKCTANQKKMVETKVATTYMTRDMTAGIEQKWANEDTVRALEKSTKITIPDLDNCLKAAQVTFTNQVEKVQQKKQWLALMHLIATKTFPTVLHYCKKKKKYNADFEQRNVYDLQKVLDSMKEVGDNTPFLQKIMSFRQKKISWGIPENQTPSDLWTYSETKVALNNNLEQMIREINREGVFNEITIKGNDTKRDKFFQDMKDKLEFMHQMSQCKVHVTSVEKLEECSKQLEKDIQDIAKKIGKNSNWDLLRLWLS